MSRDAVALLDVSDPLERENYERAFYEAFIQVSSNRLIRNLWLWDDQSRRLRVRIGYEAQAIYVSRLADGALHFAIATHDDLSRCQSAAYGFKIPRKRGVFEVLAFFSAGPATYGNMLAFWKKFSARMRERGFSEGYATCAASLVLLYKRVGWEVADKREIDGETRYLLSIRLDRGRARDLLNRHDAEARENERFVAALLSGGDSRLDVDLESGRNVYGCSPIPDEPEIHFGATTISTISHPSFEAARRCFERLSQQDGETPTHALRAEAQAIGRDIADLCSLSGARTLLAASGTDAIMLATRLLAERDPAPLTTLVVGIEETGSGVGHAVNLRHFQPRTPKGDAVTPGEAVAGSLDLARVDLQLRDRSGAPLDLATIDAAVIAATRIEIAKGRRVVVHRLDSSKTGLTAPSLSCLAALASDHGESFCVLVDACQLRVSNASLGVYHRHGWPIVVTGSKLIGGPAFSGAVILPAAFDGPTPDLPGYHHAEAPALGALLRWRAALHEWPAFAAIPEASKLAASRRFAETMVQAIARRRRFLPVIGGPCDRAAPDGWDAYPTIFTFAVAGANGDRLDMKELRALFLGLSKTQPVMRIGQPVNLGDNGLAALRISMDARRMCALARSEDAASEKAAAEFEKDIEQVFDRLESLIEPSRSVNSKI